MRCEPSLLPCPAPREAARGPSGRKLPSLLASPSLSPASLPPPLRPAHLPPRRDPYAEGQLGRVRCQLKTTGGNCAQLVQQSMGQLLLRMGLNPHFYFDRQQFQPRAPPPPRIVPKPSQSGALSADCLGCARGRGAGGGQPALPARAPFALSRSARPVQAAPVARSRRRTRWRRCGLRPRRRGSPARPSPSSSSRRWRRSR